MGLCETSSHYQRNFYHKTDVRISLCFQVSNLQERVTDLAGKSSDAGKKVYSATMYIPNMALGLTGDVIVSAKELVFALNKVKCGA